MKEYLIVFMMLAVVAGLISCNDYGTKKMFDNIELYYTDNVTEAEADALGDYLIKEKFNTGDDVVSVQLNKEGDVYQFRMVVKDGYEDDKDFIEVAKVSAYNLSKDVFDGKEVEFHLCDDKLKTLKVVKMAEAEEEEEDGGEYKMLEFDGAEIEYDETVKTSQVKDLGNYLVESGITDGSTKSIFFCKEDNIYVIYMVSSEDYWEDEGFLSDVKEFAGNISSNVLKDEPVQVALCDNAFNPQVVVDMYE
jgi:hypothetical protein